MCRVISCIHIVSTPRNANPSIAPNLTYPEYGRMVWALTFANQGSLAVNWHQVLPGQITTDIDPATNQVTISTLAPIPLRGTTDTVSVTGTYDLLLGTTIGTESVIRNQNGVPIGTTSNTLQPDGSNRIDRHRQRSDHQRKRNGQHAHGEWQWSRPDQRLERCDHHQWRNNQLNLTGSASAATLNGTGQIVNATSDPAGQDVHPAPPHI